MAISTFNQYLERLAGAAQELRQARDRLDGILTQHNSAGFSTLVDIDFNSSPVTKAQYDALTATLENLINTWWLAGHGTNIENYLTKRP